ncbi:unnamed protein product [Linum tenue]|uniref:VQ domain-containing protein n=1 Tax=Linum tenue TaxID=586396 RepID=A0AAV0IID3_9ROSI|nr:unnamed protein product [Linum tenue]
MDSSDFPVARSPRKELQGPRPPALKVRKDSHKIKKPPIAPNPNSQPPRAPVIIYTVSPKVIHTNPGDFMNLVQRLTGSSSSSAAAATDDPGAMSPAARYATIEKANSPKDKGKGNSLIYPQSGNGVEMGQLMGGSQQGLPPGILSPGPASLPPISPSFFFPPPSSTPSADPSSLGFFHDLVSPAGQLHSSSPSTFVAGFSPQANFVAGFSPHTNFVTGFSPHANSPFPSIDLFNNFNSGNFDF